MQDPHDPRPAWQSLGAPFVWMPYAQMKRDPPPLPVVRTSGVHLELADGRQLLDGLASWWTACHGYNHPHLSAAVECQLRVMPHVMFGGLQHEPALRLAARLAQLLPGRLQHVFYCDSGSVSVEVAMKMAFQYWSNQGQPQRTKFLCFENAYHGDTSGAMSVCDPVNSMHAHFRGFLRSQVVCPLPRTAEQQRDFDRRVAQRAGDLAAVMIEPLVQGAGGMKFHDAETLAAIARSCRRHGVLLIADEIATGFGRTGTMFACQQADVVPDIICLGKALTGGMLTLACTVATEEVFQAFCSDNPLHALMHGPTFMANPLACAAAHASLELFEREPRVQQAQEMELPLRELLQPCRSLEGVLDVRAKGAVGVVQVACLHHLDQLRAEFVRHGVWLRPFRDMVYVTPALNMGTDDLQQLCQAVCQVMAQWARW